MLGKNGKKARKKNRKRGWNVSRPAVLGKYMTG